MALVHATTVAIGDAGVLIRGAPGAGKSDLALRLIDRGARLVADDQSELTRDGARLWASAPANLRGKLEVRGLGILELPHLERVALALAVDLVAAPEQVERLPEPATLSFQEVRLPAIRLWSFAASAPAKVRLAAGRCATQDEPGIPRGPAAMGS